jgi:hypothetical protein
LVWNQFLTKIRNSTKLKLKNIDVEVYDVDGGKKRYIDDVQLLKEGATYFVSYIAKQERVFKSMDAFYDALKDYGKNDVQIEKIKRVLVEQDIDVMELSTLTDAKLKEVGLTQLGLRLAVLSVIENN